jgi:hypothetical protein
MPFGLPPAWNPGFAMPDNALDEGLERRALVTRQMPRGTYDDPSVGTGGYVVPQYVRDEGYGQGAFVTKWMARGEYGPRVPQWIQRQPTVSKLKRTGDGNLVTIQRRAFSGLGGLSGEPPLPAPFEQHGARAAAEILARINRLAPSERKQQLRRVLDQIDPSLWNRTAEITRRYVGQGLSAGEAFTRGLARALAAGMAADQIVGSRSSPQAGALLGLGDTSVPQGAQKKISVGPWLFDDRDGATITFRPPFLVKRFIDPVYQYLAGVGAPMQRSIGVLRTDPTFRSIAASWDKWSSSERLFGTVYPHVMFNDMFLNGTWPIKTTKHPVTGKRWGVFVKNISANTTSPTFSLVFRDYPLGTYDKIINFITSLPSRLVDLVCSMATNPNALQAGAAAGVAAGGGAAIGTAGAAIAQNLCGGAAVPVVTPVLTPPPSDNLLPIVLIGGGVLAAAILLTKKKRAP